MAGGASGRRRYSRRAGLAIVVLAVGGILLLIVQPFGAGQSDPNAVDLGLNGYPRTPMERKAEGVERQLADDSGNARLLHATMNGWIEAGDERISTAKLKGRSIPGVARRDFRAGLKAWNRYLQRTSGEADADTAERAGETFFSLMEIGSTNLDEIEANAAGAARALRISGRHRPMLFTLSNLAIYEYFNGEFADGDREAKRASTSVAKVETPGVIQQLREYRGRAETFRRQLRQAAAELRKTDQERLREPLRAYASASGLNQDDPSR